MKKHILFYSLILIFTFLLSACGTGSKDASVATAIAMTVSAMNSQNPPQVTYVVATPEISATPLPTSTRFPTSTPIPNPPSTARSCNVASFISESPSDGATYTPGASFTKSWRFKNTGTCSWNPNYRVVYASGTTLTGTGTQYLNKYVNPGEYTDIVYSFTAPTTAGSYKTVFYLQDDHGNTFAQFWVYIKVSSTSATSPAFAVTSVVFSSTDAVKTDTCPQTFDYSAAITTNKAGTVSYHWEYSDSTSSPVQTLTFNSAGTQTVSGTWDIGTTGAYWVKLYIDEPNHQRFGTLDLSMTCTPAFAVTGVDFTAPTTPYDAGTCSPLALDYQIDVAANGAGTVTYTITFSDSTSVSDSLTFSSAGTQSITGTWDVGNVTSDTFWYNIYIDEPNHTLYGPYEIVVTCP